MSNDQQAGFGGSCIGCDVACALEQQLRHEWMISNRLTILPDLSIRSFRDLPIQLKLARNHRLREIAFTNEIRHHANFTNRFGMKQKQRVAQARFLLPKRALNVRKNVPTPNLRHMRPCRCARIRIYSRAVGNDEKRSFLFRRHAAKERPTPNAQRPILNRWPNNSACEFP